MARRAVASRSSVGKIGNWLWAITILFMMSWLTPPTMIILALGGLPTAVAWLIDRSDEKFATYCVGGLNLCGIFPYLLKIWFQDHSIEAAMNIVSDVFAVAAMYAAAGFGWALFVSVPPVVSAFLNVVAQSRVTFLRAAQKKITDEWGHAVSGGIEPPPQQTAQSEDETAEEGDAGEG